MVWHVVLLSPRDGIDASAREGLLAAFERAVRGIPTVREVKVGRRIALGADYDRLSPVAFPFMIAIAFDDVEGLRTYLAHPLHQELSRRFHQVAGSALAHDFEIGGLEHLRTMARSDSDG